VNYYLNAPRFFVLIQEKLQEELDVSLGYMNSDLEGRFVKIRSEESNLGMSKKQQYSNRVSSSLNLFIYEGNFICDIVLEAVNADAVIVNSGTFRSDTLHPAGNFTFGDLKAILPFLDTIVVIQCTGMVKDVHVYSKQNGKKNFFYLGEEIHRALENSVSQYPKLEGRFAQVAGLKYVFDPRKPSGQRVIRSLTRIQSLYIDYNKVGIICGYFVFHIGLF
jgi:5'-nucleotidase